MENSSSKSISVEREDEQMNIDIEPQPNVDGSQSSTHEKQEVLEIPTMILTEIEELSAESVEEV